MTRLRLQMAQVVLATLALAGGTAGGRSAQSIRVTSDLVVVDSQVVDRKTGAPLEGLTREDFTILEDGVPQRITHFSQDQIAFSLLLSLDVSTSVLPILAQIHQGALHALQALRPDDEVAVMAFGVTSELVLGFTRDRDKVAAVIGTIDEHVAARVGQKTHIDDALFAAARYLRRDAAPNTRRVVVAVTDNWTNQPEGTGHSEAETTAELFESGALVCGLVVGDFPMLAAALARGDRNLKSTDPGLRSMYRMLRQKKIKLRDPIGVHAEETGGIVLEAGAQGAASRLRELIRRLRSSYSFGYVSSNRRRDGSFRSLEVRFSPQGEKRAPSGHIVARKGYYARAERPAGER